MHTNEKLAADTLERQLDTYTRRATRPAGKKTTAEIIGLTAAAGGMAFAGGDAMGAIIHQATPFQFAGVGINDATGTWDIDGAGASIPVYIDNDHIDDFNVYFSGGSADFYAVISFNNFVTALNPGDQVGPTLAAGQHTSTLGYLFDRGSSSKNAFLNTTNYMGFHFTGTSGKQYGWAKVNIQYDFATGDSTFTIPEWAFDDTGAPIVVGQTTDTPASGVPTPATPLLALLGLGAMGVQGYRRRRDTGLKRLTEEQAAA